MTKLVLYASLTFINVNMAVIFYLRWIYTIYVYDTVAERKCWQNLKRNQREWKVSEGGLHTHKNFRRLMEFSTSLCFIYTPGTIYGRFAPSSVLPLDVSPPRRFAPWTFRHLDVSPPGRFAPKTFRHLDVSPPRNGRFAPLSCNQKKNWTIERF